MYQKNGGASVQPWDSLQSNNLHQMFPDLGPRIRKCLPPRILLFCYGLAQTVLLPFYLRLVFVFGKDSRDITILHFEL